MKTLKDLKDYISEFRVQMYKENLSTFKMSQILGVSVHTLNDLFYKTPTKGKLVAFVKLLEYMKGGVIK